MAEHHFDLTKLYVSRALEEQLAKLSVNWQDRDIADIRQQLIEQVLKAIPPERRIFATLSTLPKQLPATFPIEEKLYISRLVCQALRQTPRLCAGE